MAVIKGAVYDPPAMGMPHVAVIIGTDGEVLVARVVASREDGRALLAHVTEEFAQLAAAGKLD